MTTIIVFNGSKWAGEEPDTLDDLLRVLAQETLDPKFERYGDFASKVDAAQVAHHGVSADALHFWGNFRSVSHAFSIVSDDPAVVEKLLAAIRANKATDAYRMARIEERGEQAARAVREKALVRR